jgi:glycosyltransferase involved in cell wall biosynthesis
MLIEDAELRKRIGRHGKKKVREFAPKRIGAKLKSIYEKLG